LEAEVGQALGRARHARGDGVDATPGYRNGFGRPRRLLPVFKRRTEEVGRVLPELSLHGLAHGDFDLALRGLLGVAAPLSAPSLKRLKASWQAE
jgi:hypothetical protein